MTREKLQSLPFDAELAPGARNAVVVVPAHPAR